MGKRRQETRSAGEHPTSCVDGPRLARDNLACSIEVACSHVSGLLMQPKPTAGPDGVREPRPHHSNGINVPTKRHASLSCVGSTDCAITRHCSEGPTELLKSPASRVFDRRTSFDGLMLRSRIFSKMAFS